MRDQGKEKQLPELLHPTESIDVLQQVGFCNHSQPINMHNDLEPLKYRKPVPTPCLKMGGVYLETLPKTLRIRTLQTQKAIILTCFYLFWSQVKYNIALSFKHIYLIKAS